MSALEEDDLDYLFELARDKTVAGRRALVATIGDLFFSQGEILTDHERSLMTEILRQLIHDVEISVRRALADRLAEQPSAPHELVAALAKDDIEVAHPLLVNSEVLQDMELIEIVRNRTLEHQLAIAIRKSLSEEVTDALVETENTDVVKTLLENPRAQISRKTMEYLVEQSQRVDTYQNPLLRRPDLEPDLAKRMYWWVSAALRTHILEHYEIDPSELDETMESAVRDLTAEPQAMQLSKAVELAEKLWEEQQITPLLMLTALRDGEVALFVALFAKYTGIRLQLVHRMMFEEGGEGLCIACKGAGLDKSTFASIYVLTRKARGRDQISHLNEMAGILSLFERIKPDAASMLLKKWQRDPHFLRAIWQVEQPRRNVSRLA
ncbi:MAG TPA: DUF2336 domain-containing protein [Aliidongia sp.]|nr:DUF2336 domain-containing protein [Aliidongia sp.]